MTGPVETDSPAAARGNRLPTAGRREVPSLTTLRHRLVMLRRTVPAALLLVVLAYEFGVARRIQHAYGEALHFLVEVALYGTVGPVLAYLSLLLLGRWLEERETSDLQAVILERARARERAGMQMAEQALQVLFAANVLLITLEAEEASRSPERRDQLRQARLALEQAIQELNQTLRAESDP